MDCRRPRRKLVARSRGKGLLKAEYVQDYIVRLWFEDDPDVTIYELDFRPLLFDDEPGEVYTSLQGKRVFRQAKGGYTLS